VVTRVSRDSVKVDGLQKYVLPIERTKKTEMSFSVFFAADKR